MGPSFWKDLIGGAILSNALEAVSTAPAGGGRFIHLTLLRREPYFVVICKNNISGKDKFFVTNGAKVKLNSTKEGTGHGYGLWTVERIAEAYGGFVDIDCGESIFTITAALKD